MVQIKNMVSASGNSVANQFLILENGVRYFKSYNSMIAKWNGTILVLGRDWDYSRTTLKYLKIFMEDFTSFKTEKANIQKQIDDSTILYDCNML